MSIWVNIDDRRERAKCEKAPAFSEALFGRPGSDNAHQMATLEASPSFRTHRRVRAAGGAFPRGGTSEHCTYYTAPASDGLPKEPQTGLCAIVPQSASARGTRHIFPATRTHAHILQPPLPATVVVVARLTARELPDPS